MLNFYALKVAINSIFAAEKELITAIVMANLINYVSTRKNHCL